METPENEWAKPAASPGFDGHALLCDLQLLRKGAAR